MNATFTVTFKGLSEVGVAAVEKMLRDDIAGYPDRVSMASASVTHPVRVVKSPAKPGSVPIAKVKAAAERAKEARNAKVKEVEKRVMHDAEP